MVDFQKVRFDQQNFAAPMLIKNFRRFLKKNFDFNQDLCFEFIDYFMLDCSQTKFLALETLNQRFVGLQKVHHFFVAIINYFQINLQFIIEVIQVLN